MKEIIVRIPGQKKDLVLNDIPDDLTIESLKSLIFEKHEDKPIVDTQRLIHSGKLLGNDQKLSDLNLNADANGSSIIHLVISRIPPPKPPTPEPVIEPIPTEPVVEPVVENPRTPVAEPARDPEPTTETTSEPTHSDRTQSNADLDDDSWQNEDLKRYFQHWDLSIRCHQLNDKFKHLVPQLKLYRACIYDHQKKLITGISPTTNTNVNGNELPRQNNDRDNAVLGAQGIIEDDGPADWLDRFYTLFRVALLLMLAFNYASTERFICAIIAVLTIALYQGGYFQLQRRRRPQNAENDENRENADRPGVFRMLFIFITRFITSLVPAQNPPVNIN